MTDIYIDLTPSGSGGSGSVVTPAGNDGEVQVKSGTALAAATNVKAGSGYLSLGIAPASTGDLRVTGGFKIISNVSGVDRPVLEASTGATIIVGGFNSAECSAIINRVSSGGTVYNQIAGTNYLTINETLTTSGNPIAFGAAPATTGTIRLSTNTSIVSRNETNTGDAPMMTLGAGNIMYIGDTSTVDRVYAFATNQFKGAVTGNHGFHVQNGTATVQASTAFVVTDNINVPEGLKVIAASGSTTELQFTSAVAGAKYWQANLATNSATGSLMSFQAQNATGTTSTGGTITLTSGTGTSAAGPVKLQTGGTDRLTITKDGYFIVPNASSNPGSNPSSGIYLYSDSSDGYFKYRHATYGVISLNGGSGGGGSFTAAGDLSGSSSSQTVIKINGATVPAAGALTTGHVLQVSGISATTYGFIADANVSSSANIAGSKLASATTGATGAIQLANDLGGSGTSPTVLSLTGASGAVNIGTSGNILTWNTATTAPGIKQANNTTNSATAATMTFQAANATGTTATGGALVLTSGTGTTVAGSVKIQTGAVDKVTIAPTLITLVPVGLQWTTAAGAPIINQADNTTNSATASLMTLQAQNATGTTATGGGLTLGTGTGTTANGVLTIKSGSSTVWTVDSATQTTDKSTKRINSGNAKLTVTEEQANVQTTNATQTTLYTWTIPSNTITAVDVIITAFSTTNCAVYKRYIKYKNLSGTVTPGTIINVLDDDSDDAAWDATVTNSGATATVKVTGKASTTIQWSMVIRRQESIA